MRALPEVLCNFHWVVEGEAARSAQLHAAFLGAFLRRRGIRGVINLRGRHPEFGWWRRETRVCAGYGVTHFDAMLDSRMLPARSMLVALLTAFEQVPRPFVIKCSGGQDRTSLASALYILWKDGFEAMAAAEAQFARWPFLHFPKQNQHWLRQFPRYARDQARGRNIADWIREAYEPEAFASWLTGEIGRESFSRLFPQNLLEQGSQTP